MHYNQSRKSWESDGLIDHATSAKKEKKKRDRIVRVIECIKVFIRIERFEMEFERCYSRNHRWLHSESATIWTIVFCAFLNFPFAGGWIAVFRVTVYLHKPVLQKLSMLFALRIVGKAKSRTIRRGQWYHTDTNSIFFTFTFGDLTVRPWQSSLISSEGFRRCNIVQRSLLSILIYIYYISCCFVTVCSNQDSTIFMWIKSFE